MGVLRKGLDRQAAGLLREAILGGRFPSGSRLLETRLAADLGVSRGTLRSALVQLMHEGLVVRVPYKGTYVHRLSARDGWEIYTLRNALEGMAARLAAERPAAETARALDQAFARLVRASGRNRRDVVEADYELHYTIVRLSGHTRLLAAYQVLSAQTRLYMALTEGLHRDLRQVPALHEGLVTAIRSRDADLAERIARDHNTADGEMLVKRLQSFEQAAAPSDGPAAARTHGSAIRARRERG